MRQRMTREKKTNRKRTRERERERELETWTRDEMQGFVMGMVGYLPSQGLERKSSSMSEAELRESPGRERKNGRVEEANSRRR